MAEVASVAVEVSPTISPTPFPSDKALKIASFAAVRMTASTEKNTKKKLGDENMSKTEMIRLYALMLDSDPFIMAEKEALMQKIMAQEGQPVYQYEEESVGDTNETICQRETAKYQECMNEYTKDLGDYTECVARQTGDLDRGLYIRACFKPGNFCRKYNCVQ